MSEIKDGGPGALPPVPVNCPADEWDNAIRKFGIVAACEWFGHAPDSEFTKETIEVLRAREDARVPRFPNVSCSQCGNDFGPGDSGFSHCSNHAMLRARGQS